MALREGLANAIKHGNGQDLSKRVHLEMDVVEDTLAISDPRRRPRLRSAKRSAIRSLRRTA